MKAVVPHPLQNLSRDEICLARDIVIGFHPDTILEFREISLKEPPKAELLLFLDEEHCGKVASNTLRPPRLAKCHYDTICSDRIPRYNEAVVDLVVRVADGRRDVPAIASTLRKWIARSRA